MPSPGSSEPFEHRHFPRAEVDAAAVVHLAGVTLHATIVDLSIGGVRVHWIDNPLTPPAPHAAVTIELELGRGWLGHPARVQRSDADEIAVEFERLEPAAEARIAAEVRAAEEAAERPRMLVLDPSAGRRHRVAMALQSAGCESYEAATPLEAIDLLERSSSHIRGVALAEHLTQTSVDEVCDFVAETNPDIKLALIADGDIDLIRNEHLGEPIAVVPDDDTLEVALHDFVDSITDRDR